MHKINKQIEIIAFPDFDKTLNIINKREKFIFLPLATIQFEKHSEFENRQFHFILIWDTGTYEDDFFNEFRKDIRCIKFKLEGNKYSYLGKPNFPFVHLLPNAYDLIENHFQENLEYYLKPKSFREFSDENGVFTKGLAKIINQLNDFDKPDAAYYYERIMQYLYTKKKYELFNKINSDFSYSELFIGRTTTKEEVIAEFNDEGKSDNDLINNLLEEPNWLQKSEDILKDLDLTFIGSVSESDFTNGSAEIFLFWDKKNDEVYQFFQWT
ncbi:hypothetical protein HYN56_18085 [Flavobacterium crocinum]|uniref:Uncharacterized protein n=1 Tax=Flavobacterium crocinum TaxID=2183896 RepID=A0A2S1YPJ6_9FLAO|nr:hypothetical protein [Flavobacterium crocinum]AWK06030.1 hypothetical protein HYN56_18085 [Flavobacterium crocinum]